MDKNILFILHFPPPVHGSSMVGRYIKQSEQINSSFQNRYINLLASKNVSDSGNVSLGKILAFISILYQLFKELTVHKPDLCYLALTATGPAFFRDVLLVTLLKTFGISRVYHMHNKGVKTNQENSLYDFLYSYVFKGADVIILSEHLYKDVSRYIPKEKVHVCPNGIPATDYIESKDSDDLVSLLFLSNLIETKGVYILLQACKKLTEQGLAYECIFVGGEGDISGSQINQRILSMGLDEQVVYVGRRYGAEKEQAFSKADIFVFPTFYEKETFGLVNVEAMQYALPIVSTPEGGIPDIIEDGVNGYLVPQKDVEALADKLEILIKNDELRKKMGEAGRKKYEAEFTLQKFEERMVEILNISLSTS